jgi:antitoxin VapB
MTQTAKLFRNGRSQAVRLPREFRFEGDRVFIKQVGNTVVLIPYHEPWQTLFDSLDAFSDDYMQERNQPAQPERRQPLE